MARIALMSAVHFSQPVRRGACAALRGYAEPRGPPDRPDVDGSLLPARPLERLRCPHGVRRAAPTPRPTQCWHPTPTSPSVGVPALPSGGAQSRPGRPDCRTARLWGRLRFPQGVRRAARPPRCRRPTAPSRPLGRLRCRQGVRRAAPTAPTPAPTAPTPALTAPTAPDRPGDDERPGRPPQRRPTRASYDGLLEMIKIDFKHIIIMKINNKTGGCTIFQIKTDTL